MTKHYEDAPQYQGRDDETDQMIRDLEEMLKAFKEKEKNN